MIMISELNSYLHATCCDIHAKPALAPHALCSCPTTTCARVFASPHDHVSAHIGTLVCVAVSHCVLAVLLHGSAGLHMQVERIQNKLLYQNFDAQQRRVRNRWHAIEPELKIVMRLWHGTGNADPCVIYDSEDGESPQHRPSV